MAANTDDDMKTMEAVAQLLKTKPSNVPAHSKPDILALWEELAILVSSGKAVEAIGVQLSHWYHSYWKNYL